MLPSYFSNGSSVPGPGKHVPTFNCMELGKWRHGFLDSAAPEHMPPSLATMSYHRECVGVDHVANGIIALLPTEGFV